MDFSGLSEKKQQDVAELIKMLQGMASQNDSTGQTMQSTDSVESYEDDSYQEDAYIDDSNDTVNEIGSVEITESEIQNIDSAYGGAIEGAWDASSDEEFNRIFAESADFGESSVKDSEPVVGSNAGNPFDNINLGQGIINSPSSASSSNVSGSFGNVNVGQNASQSTAKMYSFPTGKNEEDVKKPEYACPFDVSNVFGLEGKKIAETLVNEGSSVYKNTSFESNMSNLMKTLDMLDKRKGVSKAKSTERHINDKILYKESSFVDLDGNERAYKQAVCNANWGSGFYDNLSENNRIKNLDMLRNQVTDSVRQYYGGFERITEIYELDGALVINGVAYTPRLFNLDENINKFPLDTYDYIRTGRIAPLFDWGNIANMSSLRILSLSSYDFANDFVANDLGLSKFSLSKLFVSLPRLQAISIGGETIRRDAPEEVYDNESNKTVKAHMEQKINLQRKFGNLFSDMNFSLYNVTNSGQAFFTDSLVTYAKNRGNKNFLHYSMGVIGRFVGASGATALNAGVHLAGGVAKFIGTMFKDAMTPIDEE